MSEIVANATESSKSIHGNLQTTIGGVTFESLYYSANVIKRATTADNSRHDAFDFKTTYVNTEETSLEEFSSAEEANIRKQLVVHQYFIEDKSNILSFNPHWATDAQCHVWLHNGIAYLIFRGSLTHPIDFGVDADVVPVEILSQDIHAQSTASDSGTMRVHGTIYKHFLSIMKYITAVLTAHKGHFSSMTIVGHSLGGSIATIAGAYYSKLYPEMPINVHTFGATRVGNPAFARYYADCANLKTCRVYTEEDVSPCYPLSAAYVHPESEAICLSADGTFTVNYGDHNRHLSTLGAIYSVDVSAHSLEQYIERIRTNIYERR